MSEQDMGALMTAVNALEDTDFDELQQLLGKTEVMDDQVIICVSHCAAEV